MVARRITGGGAVYHDLGNLNYTFILGVKKLENLDMKLFALPVVKALAKMGVTAELSGRNDITINGQKISVQPSILIITDYFTMELYSLTPT